MAIKKSRIFFSSVGVLLFIFSFVFAFCLVGYRFSSLILFLFGSFFIFLAFSEGTKKRWLKILRYIAVAIALLAFLFILFTTVTVLTESGGDPDTPCDFVIVLGAGLQGDVPSRTLLDRLSRTLDYMKKFPDSIAIVSGGQGVGEAITEALAMERYLVSKGIPESRIIKEEKAASTNENIIFSKKIIDSLGGGSIGIITSDYHISRARRLSDAQNIHAVMLSAETSLPVLRINYAMREGFAYMKALLLQHI